ncbi:MAG: glycine cleavage system aminomethyltransferase GcvT [Hydrogenibacillus sp.]|nr:glycine cleavage system aminomethyltransferase GcvT [Hydrogenibacillus sp.]
MAESRHTPLYPLYKDQAKLTEFGGYVMPLQFTGIIAEHQAVRTAAGMFDVSHMGEVRVAGRDAVALLNRLLTVDVERIAVGAAKYTFMLHEDGGTLDDMLVYRLGNDEFLLVPNAANTGRVLAWTMTVRAREGYALDVDDLSPGVALLAVQGPKASEMVRALAGETDQARLSALGPFRFVENVTLAGAPVMIASRTGYTGEDGYELFIDADEAPAVWTALLAHGASAGLVPCGLGARDTLRLEAGLPLYGHELSDAISPLEAGLEAFVHWDKAVPFIGQAALKRQKDAGIPRRLVGLVLDGRAPARGGYAVYADAADDVPVGVVTSGAPSPTLGRPIAMALVDAARAGGASTLHVDVRGRRFPARVVPLPFYRRDRKK